MTSQRPLIIIGNDDGYNFGGIQQLTAIAQKFGDVIVAAPESHQSGKSSAISMDTPVRARLVTQQSGLTVYAISGTPTDCLKLAIDQLIGDRKPTLVLSGINHGFNTGISTLYSGTMGVAFEAVVHHIPAIAFSYGDYTRDANFSACLPLIEHIIAYALENPLPNNICLNVNFPKTDSPIKGLKVTKTDMGLWENEFQPDNDAFDRPLFWMSGNYREADPNDAGTDIYWIKRGYATVTPCRVDQTAHDFLDKIKL